MDFFFDPPLCIRFLTPYIFDDLLTPFSRFLTTEIAFIFVYREVLTPASKVDAVPKRKAGIFTARLLYMSYYAFI